MFPVKLPLTRAMFVIVIGLSIVIIFNTYKADVDTDYNENYILGLAQHRYIVDQFYNSRNSWNTSNLGAVLYKNQKYPIISKEKKNKKFTILIWKHWKLLQNRHLYYFGSIWHDPLNECSVTNCEFTGDDSKLDSADAVVVHLHRGQIPTSENRNPNQKWIFLNDESPFNVFALARRKPKYSELHNVFNWSMTYRSDADIPVPYGRTVALKQPKFSHMQSDITEIIPYWKEKKRDVVISVMISNCAVSYRNKLVKELKEHIDVDFYGKCGDKQLQNSCPGHFKSDCIATTKYLFYLVLENSRCKEYITEKLFYNAYYRGAIPIIQGPSLKECKTFLPPNSYLHVDNYATARDLADDIKGIIKHDEKLLFYHKWRNNFEVVNEHGYFGSKSFHLCRLCEAMNYNDNSPTVYTENDIKRFLDPDMLCHKDF